jgi:hypothetical protein
MIYDPATDNEDSAFVEPLDTGEESGDPGWEPREQGGSCNFIMGDP